MASQQHYKNIYRRDLLGKIEALQEQIFARSDLSQDRSNQEQLRLNRALKAFMNEGYIIKMGHGIYAKATKMEFPNGQTKIVLQDSFEVIAMATLNKLGIQWELGRAIQEYNCGETTQVPVIFSIRLFSRFRGTISAEGRTVLLRMVQMPGELVKQNVRKTSIKLGIPADFVRKDYFVTKAIRVLTRECIITFLS